MLLKLQRLYAKFKRKRLGPRDWQLEHSTLSASLKRVVRLNLISSSPALGVDQPRVPKHEAHPLTLDQVETFLAHIRNNRLWAPYVVAFMTGMRPGEFLGLQWSDIDLKGATIAIRRTIECNDGKVSVGETKTFDSQRRVDIPKRCLAALVEHREHMKKEKLDKGVRVFPSTNGTPLSVKNLLSSFHTQLAAAGLPKIRLYDIRRTTATLALVADISPKVVPEHLGHVLINITANTYQHVIPSLQHGAVTKLDAIFDEI